MSNDDKIKALAKHLDVPVEDITETSYGYFEYGREEYRVLTNDEAQDAWDELIESYIDECVLHELPEQYRNYFDNDAFKRDCSFDGRGDTLASYDGAEIELENDFYAYRVN